MISLYIGALIPPQQSTMTLPTAQISMLNNLKIPTIIFTYFPVSQVRLRLGLTHVPPHDLYCDITRKEVCSPFEPHPLHELHAPQL